MRLIGIVCIDKNNGIGYQKDEDDPGRIPWKWEEDMKWFKEITMKCIGGVVMGRKTYESIGKPLPGRRNIVISKTIQKLPSSVIRFDSIDDFLIEFADVDQCFAVIGGVFLYQDFLHNRLISEFYVSMLNRKDTETNVYFPIHYLQKTEWTYKVLTRYSDGSMISHYRYKNIYEKQFVNLVNYIQTKGEFRMDRTGIGVYSVFSPSTLVFELRNGTLPLLVSRKQYVRGIFEELIWFLNGDTDTETLKRKRVNVWNENSSREYLDSIGLFDMPEGLIGPAYGWQWRRFGLKYDPEHPRALSVEEGKDGSFDQIRMLINGLIHSPYSRRHVLTSHNPSELSNVALPACHLLYQFYVHKNGELDCILTQRSSDVFLALGWNIGTASFLTHLLAKRCGLKPGMLRINIGDAHLYRNHIPSIKEYNKVKNLIAAPYPKLYILSEKENLEDYEWEDIKVVNYNPTWISKKLVMNP